MEHRKFGYIRLSSKDQNEGRQLEAMRKMGIIEETHSKKLKSSLRKTL